MQLRCVAWHLQVWLQESIAAGQKSLHCGKLQARLLSCQHEIDKLDAEGTAAAVELQKLESLVDDGKLRIEDCLRAHPRYVSTV